MRGELQGLGPFRLGVVLGEGERAIVYEAEREGGGRGGALKVLRPALCGDEDERRAFIARARVGQQVVGPGVVTVLEVGDGGGDGAPWALLERVDGVSLAELFPKRGRARFSEPAASNVVEGVLRALAGAAAARPPFVHGRLDASNVLIDLDGEVRLSGFGADGDARADFLAVARLAQSLTADWSPAADSWLDGLQDHDDRFAGPADALAALPVPASLAGRAALSRAARRVHKRREQERAAETGGAADARPTPAHTAGASASAGAAPRPIPSGPHEEALRQARVVGLLCAAVLVLALVLEIFGFAG